MTTKPRYGVVIEKAERHYSAYVPDLPGCVATGDTLEQTKRAIRAAIRLHLDGLREEGLTVPVPKTAVGYIKA
jgi:predicted RNase H-like HicB family nuclease